MTDFQGFGTAAPPWADRRMPKKYEPPAPMPGGLTHRGWTLVDAAGGWRCAVRGAERIRVCREHTDTNAARRLFRARVDERMAREEGA